MPAPEARTSFLLLQIAEQPCALRTEEVQEVAHLAETLRLPGQPSVLAGFLNLRGRVVPVISLRRLFGFSGDPENLYSPLIATTSGFVLMADAVEAVIVVDNPAMQALPAYHCFNDCAEAQFCFEDRLIPVLSSERLLLKKEKECIAELSREAERRLLELGRTAS